MRWLLWVALAVGLAGAGLWALAGEEPLPPRAADAENAWPDDLAPGAAAQGPFERDGEPTGADADSDATGAAIDADERVEVDDGDEDGPRRVRVVRGTPPVPVEDAEVLWVDEAEQDERLRGKERPPQDQWPERFGNRLRTDAAGEAPLPETRGTLLVAARSEGEFAFGTLRRRRQTLTLRLEPDETLVLRARRCDDTPAAAVPLAVHQWLGSGRPHEAAQGVTDANGELVLRHFQRQRRAAQQPDGERFAALARVAGGEPVVVPFVGRPAPEQPVELRLAAAGDVELQLTDHAGAPLLSPAWVAVRATTLPSVTEPFPIQGHTFVARAHKPLGAAPVRLGCVAALAELTASVHFVADRRGTSVALVGPGQDGGIVRVSLPLGPEQVLLAGRALRPDGTPFAGKLQAQVWRGEQDVATVELETLPDGRFDVVLRGRDDGPFELFVREPGSGGDPAVLGAKRALGDLRGGQRIELGDVQLGELPPLVFGRVVDDVGAPIAGARVRVRAPRPERHRGTPWQDLPGLQVRSADDGTFTIHGDRPPGALAVQGDDDAHFEQVVPLTHAGHEVRLQLERTAELRGRVLLPDWLANEAASLELRPFDEAQRRERSRSTPLQRRRGGRFTLRPLHAGRYDAVISVRNVDGPVLTVADVVLRPGDNTDPRLDELDLRRALFRYRLRAVDPAGQPVAFDGPIQARLSMPDGAVVDAGFRWQNGRAELITPSTAIELLFFGRGYLPQRQTFSPGDHDVFLTPLQPALLELPGARALCGPERRVRVSVILTEATGYPESLGGTDQRTGRRFSFARWDLGRSSGAWLERYDTVAVPLMKSGRYEVVLRVHATESERTPQASVSLGVFELQVDAPTLRPVTVPVDPAAVQAACAEVDDRWRQQQQQQQQRNAPR